MCKRVSPMLLATLVICTSVFTIEAAPTNFGVVEAVQPVIPAVDQHDRQAHMAQARLASLPRGAQPAFLAVLEAYDTAEAALDAARHGAWNAILQASASVVVINEPLILAMLDLHIELRRRLGPTYATVVPGLTTDRGCQGDIIGERLVYAYGAAAASPLGTLGNAMSDWLEKMARQMVCLGGRQLAELEHAFGAGFETVVDRLLAQGLGDLIPAFARLVAPVRILLLDVRKHRGESSQVWQWFVTYGDLIRADVARAGRPIDGSSVLTWRLATTTVVSEQTTGSSALTLV